MFNKFYDQFENCCSVLALLDGTQWDLGFAGVKNNCGMRTS